MEDRDVRGEIAVREAREFRSRLGKDLIAGQAVMVVVLIAMAYLDVPVRWMLIVGFFLGVGTICGLIMECGLRMDAGRSYLEQWARDTEKTLEMLCDRSWER